MKHVNALFSVVFLGLALAGAPSSAQSTLEDDDAQAPEIKEPEVTDQAEAKADYGIGIRGLFWLVPKAEIELFLEEAASGATLPGFTVDFIRRKNNFEMSFGIGFSSLAPDDGNYLEKGDDPSIPGQEPDFTEFDGFSWLTFEFLFMWHKPLHEKISFRYGAGIGLGVLFGDILQTDTTCTGATTDTCTPISAGQAGEFRDPANTPPVFPVTNLVAGVQFKPMEKFVVNVEGGFRLIAPFAALKLAYFF